MTQIKHKKLRIPTGGRVTSWLFTQHGGVEFGVLKTYPSSGREDDLNPGPLDYKYSILPLGHAFLLAIQFLALPLLLTLFCGWSQVCTDEGGCEDGADLPVMQGHREREHTEARFLSDQLLEEGRWHHVMVVLNKALIRNSTCALFVDGKHVNTCRVREYIEF